MSILAIGFLQGLYALDAADGQVESSSVIVHVMVQSLLQCVDQLSKSPLVADSGCEIGLLTTTSSPARKSLIFVCLSRVRP